MDEANQAAETTEDMKVLPMEFKGQAREYFGIWIVNLLLNIITLGIYSPWAKVRTLRYLYNNTLLDGSPFDYTADPKAILRGRLIAFVAFAAYAAVSHLAPVLEMPLIALMLIASPVLVVRALAFARYHTMYRNLRFSFNRDYKGACENYLAWPILSLLSLGLLVPYAACKHAHFVINNTGYGRHAFRTSVRPAAFYGVYMRAFGLAALALLSLVLTLGLLLVLFQTLGWLPDLASLSLNQQAGDFPGPWMLIIPFLLLMVQSYLMAGLLKALTNNLNFNHTTVERVRFESHLGPWRMTWILWSNVMAIALSFGLLYPWARIRLLRYRLSSLRLLLPAGQMNEFTHGTDEKSTATGDEMTDFFDIDVAL